MRLEVDLAEPGELSVNCLTEMNGSIRMNWPIRMNGSIRAKWHTYMRAPLFPRRSGPPLFVGLGLAPRRVVAARWLVVGLFVAGYHGCLGQAAIALAGAPEGKAAAGTGSTEVGAAGRKPAIRMLEQTLALGGVPPRDSLGAAGNWAEVRAAISAEFKPTAQLITADSKPLAVAKQLTSAGPLRSGPPTLAAATEEPTGELDPVAQTDAARKAFERPVNVRTVELLAVIEPDGRLSNLSVLIPSGSSAFDDAAIAAVRSGFRSRPSPDRSAYRQGLEGPEGDRLNVRLRVSAGRAVSLPRIVPLRERPQQNLRLPSRGFVATGAAQFDETSGAVNADPPFANRLSTQIDLISVTPAPPAAPSGAAAPAN